MPSSAPRPDTTSSNRAGRAAHGPEISAVSTTMPPRHSGANAETSLRCPSQRSTRSGPSGVAPALRAALIVDDGHGAGQHGGVRLVEDDQDIGLGLVEIAGRLGLVVEAQDGGRGSPAHDAPARIESGGKGGEPEGPTFLRRWQRVDAQAGLGDDAQGPLTAHEELGQVGPRGGTWSVTLGMDDAPVGQDHLEPDDHVLDLPVAGRVLPGAAAGQPAAHRREIHRLRPVAQRVAGADPAQGVLEVGPERAGAHVGGQRRLVDRRQTVDGRHVEGHAAVDGNGAPAHAAAAGHRRHRDHGFVAHGQHRGHLRRSCRDGRRRRAAAARRPRQPTRWPAATSHARPRPARASSVLTSAPVAASRSSTAGGRRPWRRPADRPRRPGRRRLG